MLLLRRTRLINWHFFHDATLELSETTLLAGDNGSGKSTIIDAIQYALVADIRRLQFNAAATQNRTNRTLESYCRCKIGATELDYYRNQSRTHVVLEFDDDENRFLSGIMVEADAQGEVNESLWILDHGTLDDLVFTDKDSLLTPSSFREKVKASGGIVCSTKREYASRLTTLLKVHRRNTDFNPYFAALVRSVSFTPFTSVDRFVCDYILEERQVDITAMKENLLNYKEAEREALSIEEKITHLKRIAGRQVMIDQYILQITLQEYLRHRINLEINTKKISQNACMQADAEREISRIDGLRDYNEQLRQRLSGQLDDAKLALNKNDTHILYKRLLDQQQEIQFTLGKEHERMERFRLLKTQSETLLGRGIDDSIEAETARIEKEKEENLRRMLGFERERGETRQRLTDLAAEEKDLRRGILRYPESTIELLHALRKKSIEAWIFADRIEVKDPSWQNAVEGWLNTQRFNVLVAESDFPEALSVYNNLPKRIAGVGLPDLARMLESRIRPGSLAEIIEADSPLARRYAAYLLGEVMMAGLDTLREHERAVTRECMRYSGYTASRIKEEIYSRWYIGKQAKEKRLADLATLIELAEKELASVESRLKEETQQETVLRNVYAALFEMKELSTAFENAERLESELQAIGNKLAAIDTSKFKELEKQITNIEAALEELRIETQKLYQEYGERTVALRNLRDAALGLEEESRFLAESLHTFVASHKELADQFESYYAERTKNDRSLSALTQIQTNYDASMKGLETKLQKERGENHKDKHAYNLRNHTYMQEDSDDSEPFIQTLETYRDTQLPAYREKIEKARREAEQQFREHFVSRLNEYLTDARENFSELNHTLRDIPFGKDMYRFHMEAQPEKKRLLDAIREAAQIEDLSGPLFAGLSSDDRKRSIESLFESILENDLQSEEVRELCDYRKYFRYDIIIKHTDTTGEQTAKPLESSLSRVLREKSGGETQTPYYVAIAASFYRFYKDEPNAVRLVLFDEAFNKMDDDRIGRMVDFFKKLGMQVVTAVPTEKIETIAPFMERINLIIRKNYRAHIRDYRLLAETGKRERE
ncbi:MAG: AAA family ATPase [Spirochaetales bacterium]|nr:AAA family ATPase [Spirochaetales bacterium]